MKQGKWSWKRNPQISAINKEQESQSGQRDTSLRPFSFKMYPLIGRGWVSKMCPCHQLCVCSVSLPMAPEVPRELCLLVTDSSGWDVAGLERWRRKTESLILSKVQEEPAEGCGVQGRSHLHRKQWPCKPGVELGDWFSFLCHLSIFFCPRTVSAADVAMGCRSPERYRWVYPDKLQSKSSHQLGGKKTYSVSEAQGWSSGDKGSCFYLPKCLEFYLFVCFPFQKQPPLLSLPSSSLGPTVVHGFIHSLSLTTMVSILTVLLPQPAFNGALRTLHVSMAMPVTALPDSVLHLQMSSLATWRVAMVWRLGDDGRT